MVEEDAATSQVEEDTVSIEIVFEAFNFNDVRANSFTQIIGRI